MKPAVRKRQRMLEKNRKRQAFHRERQKDKGLCTLQVRISRYAHDKALQLTKDDKNGLSMLYRNAIIHTDLDNLPPRHQEVLEGELIGSRQLCPWLDEREAEKFEKIAVNYKSRTVAMSAIVNAYCDKLLAQRIAE